jgi:hypothetical protein
MFSGWFNIIVLRNVSKCFPVDSILRSFETSVNVFRSISRNIPRRPEFSDLLYLLQKCHNVRFGDLLAVRWPLKMDILHKLRNVRMAYQSGGFRYPVVTLLFVFGTVKPSCLIFHKNKFSCSRAFIYGQTDMAKVIGEFFKIIFFTKSTRWLNTVTRKFEVRSHELHQVDCRNLSCSHCPCCSLGFAFSILLSPVAKRGS